MKTALQEHEAFIILIGIICFWLIVGVFIGITTPPEKYMNFCELGLANWSYRWTGEWTSNYNVTTYIRSCVDGHSQNNWTEQLSECPQSDVFIDKCPDRPELQRIWSYFTSNCSEPFPVKKEERYCPIDKQLRVKQ